jgi:hypothetical protein
MTQDQYHGKIYANFQKQLCQNILHRKIRFPSFPSPAGMSLTKLPHGRNNSVMTSLFPLMEREMLFFTVQQRLTSPDLLHNEKLQELEQEQRATIGEAT